MAEKPATGTVYSLTDPRDGQVRYIGQTTKTLSARLSGGYAPRVRAWIAEVRATGARPLIAPVREGVPADQLLDAEREEITRVLVEGGALLNEQATAIGRELVRQHEEMARDAATRAAWRELADVTLATFGGPLPPGDLPEIPIPSEAWEFMAQVRPGYREYIDSLYRRLDISGVEGQESRLQRWHAQVRLRGAVEKRLWWHTQGIWGELRSTAGGYLDESLRHHSDAAVSMSWASHAEAVRYLALVAWYVAAVDPWRHLAEIAGLSLDDASFIAWAGRDAEVRAALEFLATREGYGLRRLSGDWEERRHQWHDGGPGRHLGAVAAAYVGVMPADCIRAEVADVLAKCAADHQLSAPMAALLMHLDPKALDTAFGPDVAAEIDQELDLPAGTSGRVARALANRLHSSARPVRKIADRAAQELPTVPLPDYGTWYGHVIPSARIVGAHLVQAGLAQSPWKGQEDYLAEVRELWALSPRQQERIAS